MIRRRTGPSPGRPLRLASGLGLLALLAAASASAVELRLPAAATLAQTVRDPAAPFAVATGPVAGGSTALATLNGVRQRSAWQIPLGDPEGATLLSGLRDQLVAAGYEVLFTCEATDCGGFDFRFARPVLPMPAMFVDLGAYSYLSARHPGAGDPDTLVSLLLSRGASMLFLQVTEITAATVAAPEPGRIDLPAAPSVPVVDSDWTEARIAGQFEAFGRVSLDGLAFQTGSSRLDETATAPLTALAAYLVANPGRKILLVGHSDWTGGLDSNVALSRARADAVATYVTTHLGIAANRIGVQGIGYLAPRTANTTQTGRDANRRVEAVLLPDGS